MRDSVPRITEIRTIPLQEPRKGVELNTATNQYTLPVVHTDAGLTGVGSSFPGNIGLFPRVLGQCVREEKLMTLEKAVCKMTSLAVQRLGIVDRGIIRPGIWADLVVFDVDTIALRRPDADPERLETFYPVGIHYVTVNGQIVMEGHRYTGTRAGRVL